MVSVCQVVWFFNISVDFYEWEDLVGQWFDVVCILLVCLVEYNCIVILVCYLVENFWVYFDFNGGVWGFWVSDEEEEEEEGRV